MSEWKKIERNGRVRRRSRKIWYVAGGIFVAVFLFTFMVRNAEQNDMVEAASLEGFDPGYIISDYQMSNYQSMSEAEIQAFLTMKNSCSNTNYSYYLALSANKNYTWHWKDGHFICLSEELFGDGEVIGEGETAAHIIWQAAQDFEINPQALLVLLQKETGLITDPIPNNGDYRKATGYGCPDTAACSAKYYGFKNQIRNAAAMFRAVLDGGWTNYPLGENYVQYNPNPGCGGSVVNIRSLATSALYRYTPYQPNAGAINAGYGTAPCGAYGNRNFYLYFMDWFGGITEEGLPGLEVIMSNNRVESEETDLGFNARSSVRQIGWLDTVDGGEMIGTAGYSLGMEALTIKLEDGLEGDIYYRVHAANIGWMDWVKNGEVAGTISEKRSLEAIEIKLSDDLLEQYDIYYRVHAANIGWMDWVKNGEMAGTTGEGRQVEAAQIKIKKKEDNLEEETTSLEDEEEVGSELESIKVGVDYSAHVANIGWMDWVKNGEMAGTTGEGRRVEAVMIKLTDDLKDKYDISYKVHVANIGWMDWVKNGEMAGTTGKSLQVEAIEMKLSEELSERYDISYRVHVANIGWMDWVKNGEMAGTTGKSLRVEAIEIKVVDK